MTELRLNPDLDPAPFAQAYARDGLVRIPNLMTAESADAYAKVLETGAPWRLTISDDGNYENELYDPARIESVGRELIAGKLRAATEKARTGFSYIYLSYPLITALNGGWDPGHPIHDMTAFMNSRPVLDFIRAVIARPDVVKADAQATLYRPGDFLSLHDDGTHAYRLAAYTLGFSRRWRPDWGGQLMFHDQTGEIVRGLQPAFNTLTLFKVPVYHSVAPVAPYAGQPRLMVVGWVRNDPAGSGL